MSAPKTRLPRPCPVCGEIFEPVFKGGKWVETCSKSCGATLGARRRVAAGNAWVGERGPQVKLVCEICGADWELPPSQVKGRRTCSIACAAELKRLRGGASRKGLLNPNYKSGKRVGVRDRANERRWYAALGPACEAPNCQVKRRLALHHVCYQQEVRRAQGDVWDPRNALTLCPSCHSSHHRRGRVLPLEVLPDSAFEFAADLLGAGPAYEYLSRRYRGGDERLDALLTQYQNEEYEHGSAA